MLEQLTAAGNWVLDSGWLVPAMGVVVFVLVLFLGWLVSPAAKKKATESDPCVADFFKRSTEDRRSAPRRQGSTVELEVDVGPDLAPRRAWVLNRSVGGLGLLLDQPLEVGAVIKVRALSTKGIPNWIDLTVRSCRREGTQYEAGCQFHRIPDWNQMLHFG